jgi:hypothetical protein
MERFEAWLNEQDISIVGQFATGENGMLRYHLRLLSGDEIDVAFTGETLLERPDDAIEQVRRAIEERRGGAYGNGNGRHS